jgi:hypothetical protein
MAHDLTAAQLNREGIAAKRDRSAPVVQSPGSSGEVASAGQYADYSLNKRLDSARGLDAIKVAAQIVSDRRSRRR